jgi:cytochrome P450
MLSAFVRHGLAGELLHLEAFDQALAGSDTTAGGIRGILLCLLTNPRAYGRLQREIDAAGVPEGEIVADETAQRMEYLQAVIREGLQIFTPVVNVLPRDVPEGGIRSLSEGRGCLLQGHVGGVFCGGDASQWGGVWGRRKGV